MPYTEADVARLPVHMQEAARQSLGEINADRVAGSSDVSASVAVAELSATSDSAPVVPETSDQVVTSKPSKEVEKEVEKTEEAPKSEGEKEKVEEQKPVVDVEKEKEKQAQRERVEEGRRRKREIEVENRRLKAGMAELEAKLAAASKAETKATESVKQIADIENLDLTPEEKQFFENVGTGEMNETFLTALRKISRREAQHLTEAAQKKLQEIEQKLEASQKAQAEFQEQSRQTRIAEFQVDIQEALELPFEEVEKIKSDPAFQKFISAYNELAGETRADSIARAEKNLNPDPLVAAVREFRAGSSGSSSQKPVAQKAMKSLVSPTKPGPGVAPKPIPPEPKMTVAEYKSRAEALVKQGAHRPEVAKQLQELKAALDSGRVG